MLLCELIATYLAESGPSRQFGVLGEGNLGVATALDRLGTSYHPARREDAAVAMADGWARRTGEVGLATVTSGPGLTNALTGLREAAAHGTPLVLLTALTPRAVPHHPQNSPARAYVEATGAGYLELESPAQAAWACQAVLIRSRAQRRPWVLALPQELLYHEVDQLLLEGVLPGSLEVFERLRSPSATPDGASVTAAVAELHAAQRPMIVAGRGVVAAGCADQVAALAARLGATLYTTLLGKGLFTEDPHHLGICGGFGHTPTGDLLAEADLVLVLGASLNPWTAMDGAILDGARLVQVDRDPEAFGRWYPPDLAVHGDLAVVVDELLGALGDDPPLERWWQQPAPEPTPEAAPGEAANPLVTRDVAITLAETLPAGLTVALDSGHAMADLVPRLVLEDPSRFVYAFHAGAIGLGLGMAMGASLAEPDRWTVLFTGDGALAMTLQELTTVARSNLPLMIVVLDDGGYGAEVHYSGVRGLPGELSELAGPDLAAVSTAFGLRYVEAQDLTAVAAIAELLEDTPAPTLVRIPVSSEPMNRWYEHFVAEVSAVDWTIERA